MFDGARYDRNVGKFMKYTNQLKQEARSGRDPRIVGDLSSKALEAGVRALHFGKSARGVSSESLSHIDETLKYVGRIRYRICGIHYKIMFGRPN